MLRVMSLQQKSRIPCHASNEVGHDAEQTPTRDKVVWSGTHNGEVLALIAKNIEDGSKLL